MTAVRIPTKATLWAATGCTGNDNPARLMRQLKLCSKELHR